MDLNKGDLCAISALFTGHGPVRYYPENGQDDLRYPTRNLI